MISTKETISVLITLPLELQHFILGQLPINNLIHLLYESGNDGGFDGNGKQQNHSNASTNNLTRNLLLLFRQLDVVIVDQYSSVSQQNRQVRYGSVEFNMFYKLLCRFDGHFKTNTKSINSNVNNNRKNTTFQLKTRSLILNDSITRNYSHYDNKLNMMLTRATKVQMSADLMLKLSKSGLSNHITTIWFNSSESIKMIKSFTSTINSKFYGVLELIFKFDIWSCFESVEGFIALLQSFPDLQNVNFKRCSDNTIALHKLLLTQFSIFGKTSNSDDGGIGDISTHSITSRIGHWETYSDEFNNVVLDDTKFNVDELSIYSSWPHPNTVDLSPFEYVHDLHKLNLIGCGNILGVLPTVANLELCNVKLGGCSGSSGQGLNLIKQFPGLCELRLTKCVVDRGVLESGLPMGLKSLWFNNCVSLDYEPFEITSTNNLRSLYFKGTDVELGGNGNYDNLKFLDSLTLVYCGDLDLQEPKFQHLRSLCITGGELPKRFPWSLTDLKIACHEQSFGAIPDDYDYDQGNGIYDIYTNTKLDQWYWYHKQHPKKQQQQQFTIEFPENLKSLELQFNETFEINLDSTNLGNLQQLESLSITLWYCNLTRNFSVIPRSLSSFTLIYSKRILDFEFRESVEETMSMLEDLNWSHHVEWKQLCVVVDGCVVVVPKHWVDKNMTDFEDVVKMINLKGLGNGNGNGKKNVGNGQLDGYVEVYDNEQMVKSLVGSRF
ncbi:unnamed protein product [Ambrosiozyma monospora]|uniref:Unnamed protein product n=1 Tax=Ambrosiozyma monospora TaxID=43982 RepID=A0A9W6YTY7_AMBMO|nr:unnamed protein product [Ambrosiozyma monospora]